MEHGNYDVRRSHLANGSADPLKGSDDTPQLLLLCLDSAGSAELNELSSRPADRRPPTIVIAPQEHPELMREAMRAGCRDFFVEPVSEPDLIASAGRVLLEFQTNARIRTNVIAIVNSVGGQGASFIAVNLAHALQTVCDERTALVDLDIQYAPLGQYLELQGRLGLVEAVTHARDLDEIALRAYLARHDCGISLLGGVRGAGLVQMDTGSSTLVENWNRTLHLLSGDFEQIVIDVPRHLDALGIATLQRADTVLLILQQSLQSIRDAAYLRQLLRNELHVPSSSIRCLVNRHEKRASVELSDVKRALKADNIGVLPNDYPAAAQSIELGKPLLEHAPRSPLARALKALAHEVSGLTVERKVRRTMSLSSLFRS